MSSVMHPNWSASSLWDSHPPCDPVPEPTAGLDILIAVATSGIDSGDYGSSGLVRTKDVEVAGVGAASIVQVRKADNGGLVAVKTDRGASQPSSLAEAPYFGQHLSQLAMELRILSHSRLKRNPHILDLLGFGLNAHADSFSCFLVEEYSDLGNLRSFLQSRSPLSIHQLLFFCLGIASGLEALHKLNICHGDVKLDNALVFAQNGEFEWRVKLCDFSHARYVQQDELEGPITLVMGTRLLCAPELYSNKSANNKHFDISHAIRTDIFSFGLAVWETIKRGASFFDDHWLDDQSHEHVVTDIEAKEDFLQDLESDRLCELAVVSTRSLVNNDDTVRKAIHTLFYSTLLYDAFKRGEMCDLAKTLCDLLPPDSVAVQTQMVEDVPDVMEEGSPRALKLPNCLRNIYDIGFSNAMLIEGLPVPLQRHVVADLERLECNMDRPRSKRGDAALMLSECYAFGFGVKNDIALMLRWLQRAAINGSAKAVAWYPRVCIATGSPLLDVYDCSTAEIFEKKISDVSSENYLLARISHFESARRKKLFEEFRKMISGGIERCQISKQTYSCATFSQFQIDKLSHLHIAAWTGIDFFHDLISNDLSKINLETKLGRTPLFYACLGGNMSIVRALARCDGILIQPDRFGITPLHLCVFFKPKEAEEIVSILLRLGNCLESTSKSYIDWEDHDIELGGTPIEWAVRCRNTHLINILLQQGAEAKGLQAAMSLFYWEVTDLLLQQHAPAEAKQNIRSVVFCIERPFHHWIAHGKDHLRSISKTFDVLEKHNLHFNEDFLVGEHPPLLSTITSSHTEGDFEIIRQLVLRGADVKFTNEEGFNALERAILLSAQNEAWSETLDLLISFYTVAELESATMLAASYLHKAVTHGSVVGAAALLRKGVNVDQITEDGLRDTPLQHCAYLDGPTKMMALLLSHGASTDPSDGVSALSPLENRLISTQRTTKLVDMLLERQPAKPVCVNVLHLIQEFAVAECSDPGNDAVEAFRHLLASDFVRAYVNEEIPDSESGTLLYKASAFAKPYLVKLLLEAGADVRQAKKVGEENDLPLQAAVRNGRSLWYLYISNPKQITTFRGGLKADPLNVACMLLAEHESQGDSTFNGITPLHLAACMGDLDTVRELIAMSGTDIGREGRWPGRPKPVRACDLIGTFRDIGDFHKEGQDVYGTPFTLMMSSRRISDNASQIWNLLQPAAEKPIVQAL